MIRRLVAALLLLVSVAACAPITRGPRPTVTVTVIAWPTATGVLDVRL